VSKSHTWFATKNDAELVIAWLNDAGACQISGETLDAEWKPDGREIVLHFPTIGPVEFWPAKIETPKDGDNSPRAKRAILAKIRQRENPGRPEIDADRSAVGGLKLPEFRDNLYWVAGHVWFATARLNDVFPELGRVCQRFERFLKKHHIVFDNTKGEDKCGFGYQICQAGFVHRIFALPEAFELLQQGAFMVDYLTSPKTYSEFRRRLQLSGHEAWPGSIESR
jgi:hypothetical protein